VSAAARASCGLFALGLVDARGVVGSGLAEHLWAPAPDPLRAPGVFRRLFGRVDPTFRRLDRLSRALVLATEAAGLGRWLDDGGRRETALVLETGRGCLEADLEFAAGLRAGAPQAPVFPYTLPSTPLGELALRHGLRGPTLCLCTDASAPQQGGRTALAEARALLEEGEARWALVACAEVLLAAHGPLAPALVAAVGLVGAVPSAGLPAGAQSWRGDESLLELTARRWRSARP
jgi:hypothetical protein